MPDLSQLTVLVKKADGSFERLSLEQIKKLKSQKLAPAPRPAPVTVADLEGTGEIGKSKPRPLPAPAGEAHDFSSLLDEPEPKEVGGAHKASPNRGSEAEAIIGKLSFMVPADYRGRLVSAINALLKEVRTPAETIKLAQKSLAEGGLGLTGAQAIELVDACSTAVLPQAYKSAAPASVTPYNAFKHSTSKPAHLSQPPEPSQSSGHLPFKLSPAPMPKARVLDIAPPPLELDPVDEIRYFTLTDFRRLSPRPAEAAARLKQKFINLREESILLAFKAAAAWRQSPLYLSYLNLVLGRLSHGAPLSSPGLEGEIMPEEILALTNLEKELSL